MKYQFRITLLHAPLIYLWWALPSAVSDLQASLLSRMLAPVACLVDLALR